MIWYLEGTLAHKNPTHLVIDVGGVGYSVNIPLSCYDRVGEVGTRIRVLTYLHVQEDALELFGFLAEEERELFEVLIGISGVGPKLAQAILSGMSVMDFKRAVAAEDVKMLTSIPRVGKKMAQRLVLELRERFGAEAFPKAVAPGSTAGEISPAEEAVLALVSLGSEPAGARRVVAQVLKREGENLSVEEIIKAALRQT